MVIHENRRGKRKATLRKSGVEVNKVKFLAQSKLKASMLINIKEKFTKVMNVLIALQEL